eukprot:379484-Rhodomonas_salina.2
MMRCVTHARISQHAFARGVKSFGGTGDGSRRGVPNLSVWGIKISGWSVCVQKADGVRVKKVGSRRQYSTVQYSTEQYSTVQHSTVQHSTAQCTVQYSTAQHSTAQYSTAQYSTVQHSTQYSTVQYRRSRDLGDDAAVPDGEHHRHRPDQRAHQPQCLRLLRLRGQSERVPDLGQAQEVSARHGPQSSSSTGKELGGVEEGEEWAGGEVEWE